MEGIEKSIQQLISILPQSVHPESESVQSESAAPESESVHPESESVHLDSVHLAQCPSTVGKELVSYLISGLKSIQITDQQVAETFEEDF